VRAAKASEIGTGEAFYSESAALALAASLLPVFVWADATRVMRAVVRSAVAINLETSVFSGVCSAEVIWGERQGYAPCRLFMRLSLDFNRVMMMMVVVVVASGCNYDSSLSTIAVMVMMMMFVLGDLKRPIRLVRSFINRFQDSRSIWYRI
jgi:hypothetical protein